MNTPIGRSLRVAPFPLAGGNACGPAKPVPRRLLAGEVMVVSGRPRLA